MAHIRVRFTSLVALSVGLALTAVGCGNDSSDDDTGGRPKGGPTVVVTTTWEGAFAKAAGAENITVIVPSSVQHAPDYDPKPSDLAAVAGADFVLYAPFEPYAKKIKDAAGSKAELVEVGLDNDADKVTAEVTRLAAVFGTQPAGAAWNTAFRAEYDTLRKGLEGTWPSGRAPTVVAQVFSVWAAKMAGAEVRGTYGPEAVTASQLSDLAKKEPALVLDNAHMTTGKVLPESGARQIEIVNYPGKDLDLLPVYRDAASALRKAMTGA
ncbi:zinc ABC transporter substrate-binding protein [Streptomyces sp. SID3343]|uniref:metal ABC transporter solute-binding protein, Zn/Mn family n=1 Tax=Streptomyces sp. SID3343 TaxID=2690260 RepID=UPI0013708425|nr:zinc ABC transporter substrate-binding protein [Streptomyces sp. SID3343]MYW03270.1 ABC transporter substrate-binding protein [Streptomyces sp. SID3343]